MKSVIPELGSVVRGRSGRNASVLIGYLLFLIVIVTELCSAGADFVVSHSSVGASILTNLIVGRKNVFLAEGVHLFWRQVPASLHGRTLGSSGLRSVTGATVVAVQHGRDTLELDLTPHTVLDRSTALILVGTPESEALFANRYGKDRRNVSSIEFEA